MGKKIKEFFKKHAAEVIIFGSGMAVMVISAIVKSLSKDDNIIDVVCNEIPSHKITAAERFFNDHPDMTYEDIYKEMNVDMSEEDTTPYKEAEIEFFKKYGYM